MTIIKPGYILTKQREWMCLLLFTDVDCVHVIVQLQVESLHAAATFVWGGSIISMF